MRYILEKLGEPIEYGRYAEYLDTIRARLPRNVYEFASNASNFDLSSHSSLHDSWLEFFNIVECAEGTKHGVRSIGIRTCYLGPFHDKRILINYMGVISYSIQTPRAFRFPPSNQTGHGDLITHEIRLDDDLLVHELIFSRGSTINICFTQFEHEVQDV